MQQMIGFQEATRVSFFQCLIAEYFATAIYTFCTIAATSKFLLPSELTIGLTSGFSAAAMITSFGQCSGAQLNPAVTIGVMAVREIRIIKGIAYIVVQILGGLTSAWIIKAFLKREDYIGLLTLNADNINAGKGIFVETMITLLVVLVYLAVTDKSRPGYKASSAIAVGLAICTGHFAGIRFTGAGMNPARAFGPAVIHEDFTDHYIYWIGPILGAACAALIYRLIIHPRSEKDATCFCEKL